MGGTLSSSWKCLSQMKLNWVFSKLALSGQMVIEIIKGSNGKLENCQNGQERKPHHY
jgi:hypothetical protein